MRSFVKLKNPRNDEITLSFTDIGKSCLSRDFFMSQIWLLTLFAKISEFTVNQVPVAYLFPFLLFSAQTAHLLL